MRPPANHRERCISREIMKLELRQARRQDQPQATTVDARSLAIPPRVRARR
jgi:hypothetical protein